MYRIIYSSAEVVKFDAPELKALLLTSRLRNKAVGLTGMLIYDAGMFLQMLEGEESVVLERFGRIKADPRHRDVTVLLRSEADETRRFGDWSMGFADVTGASQILKGFLPLEGGLRANVLDRSNSVRIFDELASRKVA